MSLSVYVAASSAELDRARRVMDALRMHGVTITCDWVAAIEAAGAANEGLSDADRVRYALEDLDGVRHADAALLLMPTTPTSGAYVELGFALALAHETPIGPRTIVSGPGQDRCIFTALADESYGTDAEAIAAVLRMAGER